MTRNLLTRIKSLTDIHVKLDIDSFFLADTFSPTFQRKCSVAVFLMTTHCKSVIYSATQLLYFKSPPYFTTKKCPGMTLEVHSR